MCRLLLMTIALLLILFGLSGLWMMPRLIQQKIEQRIQLKIGTKTYDRFTRVPIPLTVKFYIFNVTNSDLVLAGLERPKFQEVGPFMYKQWRRRDIIDFEDYNRKIKYKEFKTFYPMFDPSSSQDSNSIIKQRRQLELNQQSEEVYLNPANFNVTIINLPLLSVLSKLAQLEEGSLKRSLAAKAASRLIQESKDKILITRPANEILFDGFRVDFMESARDLISSTLGFNFDSPLPRNKFGFFHMKNGTWSKKENGELTVFTGRNDSMNDFMLVDNWNDLRRLQVWPTNTPMGSKCNEIRGTDGSQFHPGVTRDQTLYLFSPMVCRSLYIKYREDTSTRDIPLLRFTTPAELFAAPRKRPENACFCTIASQQQSQSQQAAQTTSTTTTTATTSSNANQQQGERPKRSKISDARCYLDGLMDLSLCQKGAPVAASSPHFYNADPMLAMSAGLKPQKELHETYLDIEPMTGSVFRAASRAQLNAFVEQAALEVLDPSLIGHMSPMVAPMLWLEERGEIDAKSSLEFKNQLLNLVLKANRSFKYSIAIGILLIILISVQYWYVTCYKFSRLNDTDEDDELGGDEATERLRRNQKRKKRLAARELGGGRQMRANIRLANARRANCLAAKIKSVDERQIDDDGSQRGPNSEDSEAPKGSKTALAASSAAIPIIAIAGVLGASSSPGPSDSSRQRLLRAKEYLRGRAGDEPDEDQLSKRILVGDEWEPGQVTSNTESSGRSSYNDANYANAANEEDEEADEDGDGAEAIDLMRTTDVNHTAL